ncbi:hypothetical protein SAMN04487980_102633 [Streptomyces sp. cf124]|uniref:hypothetical protein n=1 Tax=Streptomyces sp. cf124 TaxID=1761903 RepID=UPI0008EEA336|nr:hypothetical protein [Streptomyces sp. cf124]SFN61887.1 hypothetical protein SAMN04487980_102633 [Streptomyces sp. cf124]
MSNSTPPPAPGFPPPLPPPTPQPKKNRTNAIIIGAAAAIIATIITTGVVVVQTRDAAGPSAVTTAASSAPAEDDSVATAVQKPDPEPTYAEVDADSFMIKLRTTTRHCFGSAGCNVTVEPKLTYTGIEDLDPDAVYEITYEIRGDESGPVIETAELSDQTSLSYRPTSISTASASTKVSVKITDVTTRGY